MTTSLVVTLLAERSPAELESIREKTQADLNRLTVELEQVETAIAIQQRAMRSQRSAGSTATRGKTGSTRERVLKIVGASPQPMSPAEIKRTMAEQGGRQLAGGSLYATVKRLTEEGALHKVRDGLYTLPTRNGNAESGPTELGAHVPLSTVAVAPGAE
jgi:hypothetical protein